MTAWAVLTVSALWTMTTAVAEATVVTNAAVSGAKEMFEAWWAFAEGKASGIAFLALAVAVISGNEAQSSEPRTCRDVQEAVLLVLSGRETRQVA